MNIERIFRARARVRAWRTDTDAARDATGPTQPALRRASCAEAST